MAGMEGVSNAARQMRNPILRVAESHLNGAPVRRACSNIPRAEITTANHAATVASHEARNS
jgi:hypothetical protein